MNAANQAAYNEEQESGERSQKTASPVYVSACIQPPEWLFRYAAAYSQTVTVTTITVHWNDTVNADYITATIMWKSDFDAVTYPQIYNDATDLGNGTTSFRSDIFNVTDTVLVYGDGINIRFQLTQGTAGSCRFKGIEVTYTLT